MPCLSPEGLGRVAEVVRKMSCKRDENCRYHLPPKVGYLAHRCTLRPPEGVGGDSFWGFCPLTCERHRWARMMHDRQREQMEFEFNEAK